MLKKELINATLIKKLSQTGSSIICPIAIIIKDKKILLGYRHYKGISLWTCPGGRCENGETIETSLRREVNEETGIKELEIISYIGQVNGAKKGDLVPLFFCRTKQKPKLMEPDKFSEWQWLHLKDFANNLPKNYINKNARKKIIAYFSNKPLF